MGERLVHHRHVVTVGGQVIGDRQWRHAVVLRDHDDPSAQSLGIGDGIGRGETNGRSAPGTSMLRDMAPVAIATTSDPDWPMLSAVASRSEHDVDADPVQAALLPSDPPAEAGVHPQPAATASWPPSDWSRSQSCTRWPRSAICPANSVPAGPPPITSTERG